MHQEEKILFSLLKKEIATTMMQSYPGIDPVISNWKGQEITDFQEDLMIRTKGQLSEKWFYNHMKSESESLPRIDVLNMLSQYAGYSNWKDFRHKKINTLPVIGKNKKPLSNLIRIPLILTSVMILLYLMIRMINTQNYTFTFIDTDTGEPVFDNNLRVEMLMENESPVSLLSDEKGNINIRTGKSHVKLLVKVPYYITDTITRTLRKFNHNEKISLKADYYALMISYFSQSDVNSWERRREQLAGMLNEDAIFYQLPDKITGNGMALYNKQEFIDKITMPSSGLKKIEILDCRYVDGKIAILHFRTKVEKE